MLQSCHSDYSIQGIMAILRKLFGGGGDSEAIALAKEGVRRNRKDEAAWHQLGKAYDECEQWKDAARCYGKALMLSLDRGFFNGPAYFDLANMYLRMGQHEGGIEAYRRFANSRSEQPMAWLALSRACEQVNRNEESLDAARKGLALNPKDDEIRMYLQYYVCNALIGLWRYEELVSECTLLTELWPDHVPSWMWLALSVACGQVNLHEESLDAARSGLAVHPEYDDLQWGLQHCVCTALIDLGRYEDAVSECTVMTEQWPDRVEAWTWLGKALDGLGRTDEALRAFQKAQEIDPHNVLVLSGEAMMQVMRGQMDRARDAHARTLAEIQKAPELRQLMEDVTTLAPGETRQQREAPCSAREWVDEVVEGLYQSQAQIVDKVMSGLPFYTEQFMRELSEETVTCVLRRGAGPYTQARLEVACAIQVAYEGLKEGLSDTGIRAAVYAESDRLVSLLLRGYGRPVKVR